jgi:hypothetical protein
MSDDVKETWSCGARHGRERGEKEAARKGSWPRGDGDSFDLGRRRAAAAPALHCPVRLRLDLDPVHRNKI